MKPFEELKAGMYLACNRKFMDILVEGGMYKIVATDTANKVKRYVDIRAEGSHLFRVYRKDYEKGDFEYGPSLSDVITNTNVFKPKLKNVKYGIPRRVQLQRAKELRYEIEYLLDSLRYSNDLKENEKDFLRLHEIHEELKELDYLVVHKELDKNVYWEKEDAI